MRLASNPHHVIVSLDQWFPTFFCSHTTPKAEKKTISPTPLKYFFIENFKLAKIWLILGISHGPKVRNRWVRSKLSQKPVSRWFMVRLNSSFDMRQFFYEPKLFWNMTWSVSEILKWSAATLCNPQSKNLAHWHSKSISLWSPVHDGTILSNGKSCSDNRQSCGIREMKISFWLLSILMDSFEGRENIYRVYQRFEHVWRCWFSFCSRQF